MTGIVFSKDRAMQLHAFLRSFERHVSPRMELIVLYTVSSERHMRAYAQVMNRFQWVSFRFESTFKTDLLDILEMVDVNMIFFVDDQVFVRPWIPNAIPGLSLRMGLHLTRCYPVDAYQSIPPLRVAHDLMFWRWSEGEGDWGYPLSLDGHVYSSRWFRSLIAQECFSSPNTLEYALQKFLSLFKDRFGVCYKHSKVVNVPWNRVQKDYDNRNGNGDAEEMLQHWESGSQIAVESLYGVFNQSCHQEFPLTLEERT